MESAGSNLIDGREGAQSSLLAVQSRLGVSLCKATDFNRFVDVTESSQIDAIGYASLYLPSPHGRNRATLRRGSGPRGPGLQAGLGITFV
jgi:hypothetical protein